MQMNTKLIFWIPAILRLVLCAAGIGALWYLFGEELALIVLFLTVVIVYFVHQRSLYTLSGWLEDPAHARLPNGWGTWTLIFAGLYRLQREQEKNRLALEEWLARFRQAMGMLPDGVVIMDDVLFLEWCNTAAENQLGLDLSRDTGMRVTNLVRHPAFIDYLILGRYEKPLTLTLRDRKIILQVIPFEKRRQILVTHDVTELERIDMMRRDFIANASHELRTPLTVINGFLEIALENPDLDPTVRHSHLEMMAEQGQRMQHLVGDMLTLTRLESAEYMMKPEHVHMQALFDGIMTEASALSAGRHQITAVFDGPDLHGSTDELRSAFANLVSNAVRYTPDGGEIRVSWVRTGKGARFAVTDTGIGIEPQHIPRLTERFYRVDKSRSRETQGTGLGLAIVRHVILRHRGTLEITSEPGKGSTFSAAFPSQVLVEPFVPSQKREQEEHAISPNVS